MDGFWILLNLCFLSSVQMYVTEKAGLDGKEGSTELKGNESANLTTSANNEVNEIQLFPVTSNFPGQTRQPRKLFSKIHSGAAFITGFKLGNLLGKKGFELGSGQIASTHSFQLFGKHVNSAMSLSYGNSESSLPLLDNTQNADDNKGVKRNRVKEDVFLVTVIEDSHLGTPPKAEAASPDEAEEQIKGSDDNLKNSKTRSGIIKLYKEAENEEEEKNFIEEHNELVKKVNEKLSKRNNSKF